jgi:hypothetical protein
VPHGDRIVAIGLLTQRDLDVLRIGLERLYPLQQSVDFDYLLDQLDHLTSRRTPVCDRPN